MDPRGRRYFRRNVQRRSRYIVYWRCCASRYARTRMGSRADDTRLLRVHRQRVYSKYIMPTSVHIPKPLLVAVDRRARALKISRNRLIVRALERELAEGSRWSPDFFDRLESIEQGVQEAAEEMIKAVQSQRRSKKPVRL